MAFTPIDIPELPIGDQPPPADFFRQLLLLARQLTDQAKAVDEKEQLLDRDRQAAADKLEALDRRETELANALSDLQRKMAILEAERGGTGESDTDQKLAALQQALEDQQTAADETERKLVDRITAVEEQATENLFPAPQTREWMRPDPFVFASKLGTGDDDDYPLTEQRYNDDAFVDFTASPRTSSGDNFGKEINGWIGLTNHDRVIMLQVVDAATQETEYLFQLPIPAPADQDKSGVLVFDHNQPKLLWLQPADPDKDYVVVYDADTETMKLIETSTDCPPPA